MLPTLFQSIIDQDDAPIVICDLAHTVVYLNPAAETAYARYGGKALLGANLLHCHNERSREHIVRVLAWFAACPSHNKVHTFYNAKEDKDVYMIALRDAHGALIGYYEKHEFRTRDQSPLYDMP